MNWLKAPKNKVFHFVIPLFSITFVSILSLNREYRKEHVDF